MLIYQNDSINIKGKPYFNKRVLVSWACCATILIIYLQKYSIIPKVQLYVREVVIHQPQLANSILNHSDTVNTLDSIYSDVNQQHLNEKHFCLTKTIYFLYRGIIVCWNNKNKPYEDSDNSPEESRSLSVLSLFWWVVERIWREELSSNYKSVHQIL